MGLAGLDAAGVGPRELTGASVREEMPVTLFFGPISITGCEWLFEGALEAPCFLPRAGGPTLTDAGRGMMAWDHVVFPFFDSDEDLTFGFSVDSGFEEAWVEADFSSPIFDTALDGARADTDVFWRGALIRIRPLSSSWRVSSMECTSKSFCLSAPANPTKPLASGSALSLQSLTAIGNRIYVECNDTYEYKIADLL